MKYSDFYELIKLIKAAVNGGGADAPSDPEGAYAAAAMHGLENLLTYSGADMGALSDKVETARLRAIKNEAVFSLETEALISALAAENIETVVLKGFVIKGFYPSPDMRAMSDVDIYADVSDMPRIKSICEGMGFRTTLYGEGGEYVYVREPYQVEFHSALTAPVSRYYKASLELLNRTVPFDVGGTLSKRLDDDAFFAAHIIHLAEHFQDGGIGLKHFLDIYILSKNGICGGPVTAETLEKCGLSVFCEKAKALAFYWFGDGPDFEEREALEKYVFGSGKYGNAANRGVNVLSAEKGSHAGAVLKRVFLPYREMKERYGFVKAFPPLLPVGWLVRAFKVLKRRRGELKTFMGNMNADKEKVEERTRFFESLGI